MEVMILIYGLEDEEQRKVLAEFFSRIELPMAEIGQEDTQRQLKDLIGLEVGHKAEKVGPEKAIIFSAEHPEEEVGRVIGALGRGQILFDYQVVLKDEMLEKTLETVLKEHGEYRNFLKKLAYLQKLIDGTKNLKMENYDPDDWSELKLAVANGNDFLDTLVNDHNPDDKFTEEEFEKLDKCIDDLRKTMKNLIEK